MLTLAEFRGSLHYKVYVLKLDMFLYLRTKFHVSGIILTIFRQGVVLQPPPHLPVKKPLNIRPSMG